MQDNKTMVIALRFAYSRLNEFGDCEFGEISNKVLGFLSDCGISFRLPKIKNGSVIEEFWPIKINKHFGIVFCQEDNVYSPVGIMSVSSKFHAFLLANYNDVMEEALSGSFAMIVPDRCNRCVSCGEECSTLLSGLFGPVGIYCKRCGIDYKFLSDYKVIKKKNGLFVKKRCFRFLIW